MLCMQNVHIHTCTFTSIGKWLKNKYKNTTKHRYTHISKNYFRILRPYTRIWSSFHTYNVKMNCMHAERRGAKFEEPIRIAAQTRAIHAERLHTNPSKMIRVENENCSSISLSLSVSVYVSVRAFVQFAINSDDKVC